MWNVAALLLCAFITTVKTSESTSSLLESKVMYSSKPTDGADSSWFKYAEYKWLLSLRYKWQEKYVHRCFAVWIAPGFGMTAKDCLDPISWHGVHSDDEARQQFYVSPRSDSIDVSDDAVYKVVNHVPLYKYIESLNHDLSLMQGAYSVSFLQFEKNIELLESSLGSTIFEEDICSNKMIGWNGLEDHCPRPALIEVKIEVLPRSWCNLRQTDLDRFCVEPMLKLQELTYSDRGALVFIKDKGPAILVPNKVQISIAISLPFYKGYIDRFVNSLGEGHF